MAISKIILNGVTQMDLTQDTVEASNLLSPYTAHKADGTAVTGTATSGSGFTTVASGTFTGTDGYNLAVSVGKKMPKTDFLVYFRATKDTEFAYSSKSKFTDVYGLVFSDMGYFDLSTVGDSKQITGTKTYKTNNSGTKTTVTMGTSAYIGDMVTLSNNTFSYARYNNFRINRKSDHFEVRMYHSNSNYAYPTGITYSWKIIYFGSNPSTDIVEIT